VGKCTLAGQSLRVVTGDGQQGRGDVGAHTFDRHQRRRRHGHELVEVVVQFFDLGAEMLITHGDRLQRQLRRRSRCREFRTPMQCCRGGYQLGDLESAELGAHGVRSGDNQGVQFVGRLGSSLDRRLASDAQHADHFHGAIASLGLGRGGSCQHRPRSCFCVDTVRLPSPTTCASVWPIDLDDNDIAGTEPTRQSRAIASGAFHPHSGKLAVLTCPANKLRETGCGRGDGTRAQQPATLIERGSHVHLGMGIDP
jgi:hypothetical protein